MICKQVGVAMLAALASWGAAAATSVTTYEARFVNADNGTVRLDGFGRGTSSSLRAPSFDARIGPNALGDVPFFDTWTIDVSAIAPGLYSFENMVVDALGSTTFTSITFNSYDAEGFRNTVLFDLNALGTQAVGSGNFTVLASCPVRTCVWIDVAGLQAPNDLGAGYNGTAVAAVVPEPATAALWLLGLAGLGVAARRRPAA